MPRLAFAHLSKRLLLCLVLVGILIPACLFLARGWIRGPLIDWYAERVYVPKIERAFEQDFAGIDAQLLPFDFTFNKHETRYMDRVTDCHKAMYEGISLSKFCYKMYFNDYPGPVITDDYRELWRAKSPEVETYILDHGWIKTWNAAQPIDELLIRDDRGGSVGVNYEKHHGELWCKLSIWYNGSDAKNLNVEKSCTRTIKFFGGY